MVKARTTSIFILFILCFLSASGCKSASRLAGYWMGESEHVLGRRSHSAYLARDGSFVYMDGFGDAEVGQRKTVGNWLYDPDANTVTLHSKDGSMTGQVVELEDRHLVIALETKSGTVHLNQFKE